MGNSCSELKFLEGGTIADSTIMRSEISNSVVSNSTIETSTIEKLAGIDAASATTITNKIVENVTNIRNISNAVAADETSYKAIGEKIVLDEQLVRTLVQTIAALPASALSDLVEALAEALSAIITPTMSGATPVVCKQGVLPGRIAGNEDYLLGAPTGWVKTEDGAIPVYPYDPCGEAGGELV